MVVSNHHRFSSSPLFSPIFPTSSYYSSISLAPPCLRFTRQKFKNFFLSPPNGTNDPTSTSSPSPSIFLGYLEAENIIDQEKTETAPGLHGKDEEECPDDPIYRFFKSRSCSTRDPPRQSKLVVRSDRRVAWKLARFQDTGSDADEETPNIKQWRELEEQKYDQLEDGSCHEVGGVVGEILNIARNLPENTTLGEKLGVFDGRLGEEQCVEALKLLVELGFMLDCLYMYEWMDMHEPSLVSPNACSVLFPALGRGGMGDKIMVLWRSLPISKRRFRDVHVYNAALSGLLSSGRYNDAWEVYNDMEMNNILPDRATGSIMITVMRKQGRTAKEAWGFFERMSRKGLKWSLEVCGALIKSFCDEGLRKQALIIQAEMEKKGVSSNIIIYNTLMDAYCKSNLVEEAEALFAEMKSKGLAPSTPTYNILMDAYCKRVQPEIVEKLLLEMQEEVGLEPDVKSYTCLISSYGKKEMSDMAADAFLRMKSAGIKPSSHSYTALIHAYSVDGWHEKAYRAFTNMLREGIKPSIETYTALLDAFRRAGDTDMLMKIWKSMISERIEGTRVTFNILVDGFAKQGRYVEARDAIFEFGKQGLQPTVMTYNMLMNAYARGGQHLKLPQLLKEMTDRDLKPDSVTYLTMIYAFVRVRDYKRAFFYHKQMVKSGQVPDPRSYEKLRSILDVKAAKKNKRDKIAIMGIVNSKMGLLKVKKKGKKDEFWKNRKRNEHVR